MTIPAPPRALLLDFGGVIVTTAKREDGVGDAARHLDAVLRRGGLELDDDRIERSLRAGLTALKHWKHASSRRRHPREMSHREVVGDFLAADLPERARAVLTAEAGEILDALNTLISDHRVRPGIEELLDAAATASIPVGVVSNAHAGRSHRRILAERGLADRIAVQVYSDEVGVRKPNPAILELAADALGVPLAESWYVGDTMDRDVVAGRRAGVGLVAVTRDKHTDSPPFAVSERPDALYDTPEGVASLLARALAGGTGTGAAHAPGSADTAPPRGALFIDHGGVISASEPDPAGMRALAAHLARLLSTPSRPFAADRALDVMREAAGQRSAAKRAGVREIAPAEFWGDLVGGLLDPRAAALLRAESADLMHRYGRAKSRRSVREGIPALLRACRESGLTVVVVSNTLSGRAVRDVCAEHGLTDLIAAYVCSDEVGIRKPDRRILDEAIVAAGASPALSWFYGDKPGKDAAVALEAGVRHRIIVRGGSTPDAEIDVALADGLATGAVDDAHELVAQIRAAVPTPAVS